MDPNQDPNKMSFEDAFDADEAAPQAPNDDAEFGLIPDPEEIGEGQGGEVDAAPAVAVVVDAAPADTGADDAGAAAATEEAVGAETDPPAAAETAQEQSTLDIASGETFSEPSKDEYDAAVKTQADDFGEEHVNLVITIASFVAHAVVKQLRGAKHGGEDGEPTTKQLINEIGNLKARMHFERIFDKHEDFMEIAESPEFTDWVNSKPDEEKQALQDTFEKGNARAVIKMLDQYKAESAKPAAPDPDEEFADVEGVASSGLRMPETVSPGGKTYEDAWDEL